MLVQDDFLVEQLGPCTVPSPLGLPEGDSEHAAPYVPEVGRIAYEVDFNDGKPVNPPLLLEKAGPRARLFFDPKKTTVGIVTCGGLCPGLNNVIRSLVLHLHHKYGVPKVLGFRYGYEGLSPTGADPMTLGPAEVREIHRSGGSILGLGRGKQPPAAMADTLKRHGVDVLFVVGGDGTLKGAHALAQELLARGQKVAVVGIPKTIDNDVADRKSVV